MTTPSPEYAISIRNVLEDLVVDEAKEQIQRLGSKVRIQLALGEVAAYALNRLPPLYASTDRGWLQQRKRANNELRSQIINAVHHGMMAVRRDPLRQPKPIPQIELESTALALSKLAKLLNKPELTWKEVPAAVEEALVNGSQGIVPINLITDPTQRRVSELMGYLKRSKVHHKGCDRQDGDRNAKKTNTEQTLADESHKENHKSHHHVDTPPVKDKEFESYMLSASCFFVNALEKVIVPIAQAQMERLDTVLSRKVKLEDVVAYSLNRLPPLYATCEQGLLQQRHRAHAELASEIESTVVQSILTLSKSPKRLVGPLPLARFNLEHEQALVELRQILKRGDITWRNVNTIVEKALEYVRRNRVNWRQQWQTLGQIYDDLSLQPGDADITLIDSTQGDVLTIKANSRKVFGVLVDNPRDLAAATLMSLPEVAYIELRSSLFDFPLTYTRSEMVDDGVLPY
ncbi:late competence development ComFB family protein [Pseudanabaena sp. PCC 6802]|uniref:late competence development ComFB family protein n=1 Tax=Pseudanabaena sp. PCC 6802 TaxID=118173 RepID=UPI000371C073|nr:late competence development ComFB family protein [Pseudanabaena sp. PCC 6802]